MVSLLLNIVSILTLAPYFTKSLEDVSSVIISGRKESKSKETKYTVARSNRSHAFTLYGLSDTKSLV